MTTRSKELEPGFRRSKMSEIKGTRTRNVVTFNPNKASPDEEIYIDIPKLKSDVCMVPDSLYLQFDFKNANVKSWFLNNLRKLLCERFVVKFLSEELFMITPVGAFLVFTKICGKQAMNEMI